MFGIKSKEKKEDLISHVRNKIPDEETICALAELFKVFGDATRAKIISCLEIKDFFTLSTVEQLFNYFILIKKFFYNFQKKIT